MQYDEGRESRMLVGQYDYAIDAKGRLNFPARFRDAMGETFIVTRWLDHCLATQYAKNNAAPCNMVWRFSLPGGRNFAACAFAANC